MHGHVLINDLQNDDMPKINAKADTANKATDRQGEELAIMCATMKGSDDRDAPDNAIENKCSVERLVGDLGIEHSACHSRYGEQGYDNG